MSKTTGTLNVINNPYRKTARYNNMFRLKDYKLRLETEKHNIVKRQTAEGNSHTSSTSGHVYYTLTQSRDNSTPWGEGRLKWGYFWLSLQYPMDSDKF